MLQRCGVACGNASVGRGVRRGQCWRHGLGGRSVGGLPIADGVVVLLGLNGQWQRSGNNDGEKRRNFHGELRLRWIQTGAGLQSPLPLIVGCDTPGCHFVMQILFEVVMHLDYFNFKNKIAARPDQHDRPDTCHDLWLGLYRLQKCRLKFPQKPRFTTRSVLLLKNHITRAIQADFWLATLDLAQTTCDLVSDGVRVADRRAPAPRDATSFPLTLLSRLGGNGF